MKFGVLSITALLVTSPALAQDAADPLFTPRFSEPQLQLRTRDFTVPVVEYRAPDGTIKISHGIVIGRDISPAARVGLGFFKMKPKYDEDSGLPTGSSSRKVALGFSLRF